MRLEDFRKLLEHKKPYRNLSDIYKTDKFLLLYLKMYEYMESIPKEEIVYKLLTTKRNLIYYGLLYYIECFLKAKDFYNWRYRVYNLMTTKLNAISFKKYELLYNSKAVYYHSIYVTKANLSRIETSRLLYNTDNPMKSKEVQEKLKQIYIQKYDVENPYQLEEVKEKIRKRHLERLGVDNPMKSKEVQDKAKETWMRNLGVNNPMKSKEVQNKVKTTNNERYDVDWYSQTDEWKDKTEETNRQNYDTDWYSQTDEWNERRKQTNIDKHGKSNVGGWLDFNNSNNHSKISDDFCASLYSMLPDNIECIFYEKDNKEYSIENKYYDFCIPDIKIIIEFDGLYWHGLLENQKDVLGVPVEDIWNRDREKQELAESMGFRVIRVREDEYKENRDLVLNKLYNFIMKKGKI